MFRRRSFLIGCGSLAAAPAWAGAHAAAAGAAVSALPAAQAAAGEGDAPALRIAGWDTANPQRAADSAMWVHVGSSWQVAWR